MEYRERIYDAYVTSREIEIAPATLAGFAPRAPFLRKLIVDHFPRDRGVRILDLGSGHGALIHFAREAGYENVAGIDVSPQQVAAAARLGIAGVVEGDLMDSLRHMDAGTIDVVVAFDIIEHLTKPEALAFVDEALRVLRTGGRFIVHTCNGDAPFAGAIFFGDFTHETCFNRASMTQLLKAVGFSKVRCFEDEPVRHGVKSLARWLLWKVFRNVFRLITAAETGDVGRNAIYTRNFLTVAER